MRYSDLDFNPSDEGFNLFKSVAEGFNDQRYLNGYYNGRYDEFDIRKKTANLNHAAELMKLEIEILKRYKEPYLNSFASNDIDKFKNRINIPNAAKLATTTFVTILKDAQIKPRKRAGQKSAFNKSESLIHTSSITSESYQTSTDSLSGLPDYHQNFFHAIEKCLNLVNVMIAECTQLLKEENEIKKNPQLIGIIHDNQVQEIRRMATDTMGLSISEIIETYGKKTDPIYVEFQKASSVDEFLSNCYHVFNKKNMFIYVMNMMIREVMGNEKKNAIQELIPQKNWDKVNFVLDNIERFREFLPKEKRTSKIARFFIWAEPTNIRGFYDLFCSLNLGVEMAKYNHLTSVISKQKKESSSQVENYCSQLEEKIENSRTPSAQNAGNTAVKPSLQQK